MEFFNSLNLKQIKGGTKLKQGDLGSVLSYSLTDENGQEITSFDNKTAYINLVLDDKIWFTTTTLVDISRVTFRIDKAIPIGLYYLEIKIDDYIFPSDRDSIILIEEGSTPYDLKELVPNYDINMTLKGILSDLSQKGIDISDLKRRIGNVNAQLAEKANKDEVTNVMTPKGTLAYASLPTSGNQVGWYYYCPDGDGVHGAGNYVWNGKSWYFGGTGDEGYNLLKEDLVNKTSIMYEDVQLIKSLNTGLKGFYGETGALSESSGWTRFYIPVLPNTEYNFTVDFTYSPHSYMCEFDSSGTLVNVIGNVNHSLNFRTKNNTHYLGFGCLSNGLKSVSLIQKNKYDELKTYTDYSTEQLEKIIVYGGDIKLEVVGNGYYNENGNFISDTGWKKYYIPVFGNSTYTLNFSGTYNPYTFICEFNESDELVNIVGNVISKTFTTKNTTRYIGVGVQLANSILFSVKSISDNINDISDNINDISKKVDNYHSVSVNKYRLGTFIYTSIDYSGNYKKLDNYILQKSSFSVEPNTSIIVKTEDGYSYYLVVYDIDGTFVERTINYSEDCVFRFNKKRKIKLGIFSDTKDVVHDNYEKYVNVFHYSSFNDEHGLCGSLGAIYFEGDFVTMTKSDSKKCDVHGLNINGINFSAKAKVKWQGSSTLQYNKKNFTVTLYDNDYVNKKEVTINEKWGALSKYVLKANYVDHTMAKNVVCAKIFSDIVSTRENDSIRTKLSTTPNNGEIDGLPIKLYINNEYMGLYTFNLAKDEYLFGEDIKIFVDAEAANNSTRFRAPAIFDDNNWAVEYSDTEDVSSYLNSFNQIYTICMDKTTYPDGDIFKNAISEVVDIPSMIDKMIMISLCGMSDQFSKNQMFATYDGIKWFTTMYDMDTCFGFDSAGNYVGASGVNFNVSTKQNLLMSRIKDNYTNDIYNRYKELRKTVLSDRSLIRAFRSFVKSIPKTLYNKDEVLYGMPDTCNDTVEQILEYLRLSCSELDTIVNSN